MKRGNSIYSSPISPKLEISTALISSTTNYNNEDAISQYNTTLNSQSNYSSTSFDRYIYFKFSTFISFNLFNSF